MKKSTKKSNSSNFVKGNLETNEKRSSDDTIDEIQVLAQRIKDEAPERGYQSKADPSLTFASYPLSEYTQKGLQMAKLEYPTDIQAAAISHALVGRDILGIAKTGSGKTLAFTIPLLERLYHEKWDRSDGLAAIIISPTRELAYQIFQVLRIVGKYHQYSAGLITGGMKEYELEQERIISMNILVATPGRLLQHFEQTVGLDASQLLILVLDEADRILDMGFKDQLDGILEYLPSTRQTLLFSATQTKSVKDLARLSLKDPEYLAVHSKEEFVTPKQLIQNYSICKLEEKLDVLFSFIKSHLQSKIIVFFSTCSQVKFVFECFRGLQPGIVLTALHGKVKQERRTHIYMDFVKRKAVCMFATDIAARGLDFPDVDWVVQVDAPEDTAMYIHRVGRTARYNAGGRALLLLLADEEKSVVTDLQANHVPISKLTINSKFKVSVASRAAALLASRPECKELAKKAFTGYLRSLQLVPQQRVDVTTLPLGNFATALGLPFTPPLPILSTESSSIEERNVIRGKKNVNRALDKLKHQIKEAKEERKRKRLEAQGLSLSSSSSSTSSHSKNRSSSITSSENENDDEEEKKKEEDEDEDEDENLFQVKQTHSWNDDDNENNFNEQDMVIDENLLSRSQRKKLKAQKIKIREDGITPIMKAAGSKKVIFQENDENNENENDDVYHRTTSFLLLKSDRISSIDHRVVDDHIASVKARIDKGRYEDEMRDKERIKNAHKLRRQREKGPKAEEEEYEEEEYEEEDMGEDEEDDSEEEEEMIQERVQGKKQKILSSSSISSRNVKNEEDFILKMFG